MFGVPKICQRRREAVGWRTPDKVGVQFFPGNISTATWLGDLPSSCHTMWWTHSWVGRLQAIAKKIYMQVINCPKRMVPVLSSGEGTQTNMRTGIGSPAFGGVTPMTFYFIGWEECFNYKTLSRWRWYHRRSAGRRCGNWTLMYQVPPCREAIWEIEVISKYVSCDSSWQWSSR